MKFFPFGKVRSKNPFETSTSFLFLPFLVWGSFFLYVWPKMLQKSSEGLSAGTPIVWADWALHFCISSLFAYRPMSGWFRFHPIYLRHKLDYPFVVDAISGLLIRCGFGYRFAYVFPSIIFSLFLLYCLSRLFKSENLGRFESLVGVSLLFLNGGMGFVSLLPIPSPFQMREVPTSGLYSLWTEKGIQFGNTLLTELFPQRAFLLGLPIAILLMVELSKRWENEFKSGSNLSLCFMGLGAGSLVFIHAHSLIVVALFSIYLTIRKPRLFLSWLWYGIPAVGICGVWFLLFRRSSPANSFFGWSPGWMASQDSSNPFYWIAFWWLNWGLFFPLSVFSAFRTKLYRRPLISFGFLLFILCNLVRFQPWIWDNTKLFTFSYLFLSIPIVSFLSGLFRHGGTIGKMVTALSLAVLMATGAVDLARATFKLDDPTLMWSTSQMNIADDFRKLSNPNEITLASTNHHHWVASLSGRQIVMGYAGWLSSYGIDYTQTLTDISDIYRGGDRALALLKQYHISFVVIGPLERDEFHPNETFFAHQFPVILSGSQNHVYRVN